MKNERYYEILSYLLIAAMVLTAVCVLGGVTLLILRLNSDVPSDLPDVTETDTHAIPVQGTPDEIVMGVTADRGTEYIDQMVFIGESTTSHLKNRGVLTGGSGTEQVWSKNDNTRTLSSKTTSEVINIPNSLAGKTIAEACAEKKPAYVVLSFGLNGISGFIADKNAYVSNYGKLIRAIQAASPDTKIILQSVYPIRASADSTFSDVDTTNRNIMILNSWLPEIAAAHENVRFCDTASVLRTETNELSAAYDNGDGVHLTKSAYEQILSYLRTHAWQ